jgi:hypothetical protein
MERHEDAVSILSFYQTRDASSLEESDMVSRILNYVCLRRPPRRVAGDRIEVGIEGDRLVISKIEEEKDSASTS